MENTKLPAILNQIFDGTKRQLQLSLLIVFAVCLFAGCGGEPITKAGGIVNCDGKPLSQGTIEFYPVAGGRTANAVIQEDGTFTISYRQPGDGLPPGEYKVAVISVEEKKSKRSKKVKVSKEDEAISGEAYDEADFAPSATGKTKSLVPRIYNNIETTPLRETVADDGTKQYLEIEIPAK